MRENFTTTATTPTRPGLLLALEMVENKINQINDLERGSGTQAKGRLDAAAKALHQLKERITRAIGP